MSTNLTFDQLRSNLCIPLNSTKIQEDDAISKYIGKVIDLNNRQIVNIDIYNGIDLSYIDFIKVDIHIIFKEEDLTEKKLTQFSIGDYVNISAELLHVSYLGASLKEYKYPYRYSYKLISIEKQKPIVVQQASKSDSSCFIATACYGNCNAPEVIVLRKYRDERLLKTSMGKKFVWFYYLLSPFLAKIISKSDFLKRYLREFFLKPIVTKLQRQNK